ncbi:hypothetical protein [Dendronalium sp. ChiSLP03b]|uniref:hypothetical protein n=1 Tax=Dendronalium sp. ChiSLP03b TaxID=3075381 RepID=UPI002AD203B3|nr:hypothetical protein [Dendronalium sp. ChiSLP03b]MDZ8207808.1 hypothetical protein [Dendronalium sp. ChiSLP03b]
MLKQILVVAIATLTATTLIVKLDNNAVLAESVDCSSTLTSKLNQSIHTDLKAQGIAREISNIGLQGNYGLGLVTTGRNIKNPETLGTPIALIRQGDTWKGYIRNAASSDASVDWYNGGAINWLVSLGVPRTNAQCVFELHIIEGI